MDSTRDAPRVEHLGVHTAPPVAVVTGASRGLGAGIAEVFTRAGFAIGACARTRPELPAGTVTGLTASVDVRDAGAVAAFASRVTEEFGPIDLWVNNAGVLDPIGPLRDAAVDALTTHVEVNLLGVLWGTRTFAGIVHDRAEPGTLINISSGAASSVYEGWAAYCATKAAVDHLTRVVAAEEADHGLVAFAVAPGVVDTDMQALIRSTPVDQFPSVGRFHELKSTNAFNRPGWVASCILELHRAAMGGRVPDWVNVADPVLVRVPPES
ncbi:MAG TPA: SDR family NAD(P)-dependent oxidoreductase [Acidimicrobiales bacterium]|nr:SDR family NAD(P)-dependent oxidoreductase [Acidimicrobiales bacterium]